MYSLRILTDNGHEHNHFLGYYYTLIKYEEYNADNSAFNNLINTRLSLGGEYMPKEKLKEYVYGETKHYATVIGIDGNEIDLFADGKHCYYIMINGNTFDNLTKR